MSSSIIWIGMDVHKDTVMVAVYADDVGRRRSFISHLLKYEPRSRPASAAPASA